MKLGWSLFLDQSHSESVKKWCVILVHLVDVCWQDPLLLFQIVFIPMWIVMCVALVGVLYAIILAIILLKSPDIVPEQRHGNVFSAVGYTCLVVPLLVFEVSDHGFLFLLRGKKVLCSWYFNF